MGRPAPTPTPVRSAAANGWLWLGLVAVALVAYLPALGGALLWDDANHLTRPDLRSLHGLFRIWCEIGSTQQYYPVLHTAFWIEHRLWGEATAGYHLLNVLLHATAAFQFIRLLRRLAVPGAAFAGLLFALHPVCVESVAWISEQKNTLSAVFYLTAALAWLRFEQDHAPRSYVIASLWFLLALLTKTVTATLPAALLVLAWWRRGRIDVRRDVVPLLPWFAAGAAGGLFTAHFERVLIGAQGADFALGFIERLLLAGRVVWFYAGSLVWPFRLNFIYPRWTIDASPAQWLPFAAAVALLGVLVWWSRRRRGPLAAALLFAGTLFPVLGFFNVFPFVFSYVADHFQYLASLALFALAAGGAQLLTMAWPAVARRSVALLILVGLGALTWRQSSHYRDQVTLYEATLARNPDAWLAHHNLAILLAGQNRLEEAVTHLETVLRLKPNYAPAANNLGNDLLRLDRAGDAVPLLRRAVELEPRYAVAHRNLGLALATLGKNEEALASFATAARLDPTDDEAELNQGLALMLLGRFPDARPHFERSLALAPGSAEHRYTYGRALAHEHGFAAAVEQLEAAIQLAPDYADAHLELAQAYRQLGRDADAAREHALGVELNSRLPGAR